MVVKEPNFGSHLWRSLNARFNSNAEKVGVSRALLKLAAHLFASEALGAITTLVYGATCGVIAI